MAMGTATTLGMAMGTATTLGMAMATATTLGMAMATATTPATTTTEGAASETAIVPPTSSAVTSGLATSAPAQQATIMFDQKTGKGTKIKSAPGQAITDNNQHNNIDKKF